MIAVRASGENAGSGEGKENLVDGSAQTKWLVFDYHGDAWVEFEFASPITIVDYALTSANDAAGRDPKDWTLSGSNDGTTWTKLDQQSGQDFPDRFSTKEYRFSNATAYRHYRLDFTANHGDDILQLAEVQLSNGDTTPPPPGPAQSRIGGGPRGGYNAKSGVGFTGLKALRYAGTHTADGRAYTYNKVFDVDVPVTKQSELSYLIYPDFVDGDLRYPSTYAAVDLAFTDGTYLSDLGARDQHGATLSPRGQGESKMLYTNQWNLIRSRIGDVAAGKTIDRVLVAYDNPDGPTAFGGWFDDIRIEGAPQPKQRSRPSDWVVTTRGTNSSSSFSRGNNIPATAMPHGFNFWIPVTNASSLSWLYEYQRANNADNRTTLAAFAASHEPSPWMGERQTFQVMPSKAQGEPSQAKDARALPFSHENEIASPHHYGVKFENGITADIAPTDHAALFRFRFPDGDANLIFDNVNDNASLTIDQKNGVVSGWSDVRSGLSAGATRLFVYATFDRPMVASGKSLERRGYAKFDAPDGTVNMRIATSLISLDQAKKNLTLELTPTDTFDTVRARAQAAWDRKLGVIDVEGATDDQRTTLYSNLYRLSLYPNSAFENTGSAAKPRYQHAVQSSTEVPASTATKTGAPVKDGKVYVNNGFWDTYRTAWSAYALFEPGDAGELVDGFVQQYRDGGWIARWSSPGYANLMTGTSSDAAFADVYVKGIKGFSGRDAYDAALKNATVAPPGDDPDDTSVGRKGLQTSLFLGYTPSSVPEGVSWALEGDINDFGISNMGKVLADLPGTSAADRKRYLEESEYFRERARNYVNVFDPAVGFFQARSASGRWKSSPDEYDPLVRGHDNDYTETDGWGFAFHVPQEGQGLANLYGGTAKLDTFFSTPETAKLPGSYGGTIHDRGARRADGPVGLLRPGVAPRPVDVHLRAPTVEDGREAARGAAAALPRLRDRPGLRGRRGQRRDVSLVPVRGDGPVSAAGRQPELRDRLTAVHEGDDPPAGRRHRHPRTAQQRPQPLRPAGIRATGRSRGSNDGGTSWTVLDSRSGESFQWRSQTRAFKIAKPGEYQRYRLVLARGGKATLSEVELLNHDEAVPLGAEVAGSATWPGSTVPVRVDVWNTGGSSLSGDVSLDVPQGWTASPAKRAFGPLASGRTQTLTFDVTVPAGVSPGDYDVEATATSGAIDTHGTGTVHVLGNTIEFSPGTSAEEPWLYADDGSQLDGTAYDGRGRFTDNGRSFVYRFDLPSDVQGGTLSLEIANEFNVEASTDGSAWSTVLHEDRQIMDQSNRAWRGLDLDTLRGSGHTVYLRFSDSFPADGWGAWLARTRVVLQR